MESSANLASFNVPKLGAQKLNKNDYRYQKVYDTFIKWKESNGISSFDEDVLLTYFDELAKTLKSSSLWHMYSLLKRTLGIYNKVDMSTYKRLLGFLKEKSIGFDRKRGKVFSAEEISRFLMEAPDDDYLAMKTMMIFGVTGGCRGFDLLAVKIDYLTDYGNEIIVNIPDPKKNTAKLFVITGDYAKFVRKYMQLRPAETTTDRFFLKYSQGECENQVIARKRILIVPKEIAKFLNLDDYKSYTGHSFQPPNAGKKRLRPLSNLFNETSSDASERMADNGTKLDNVVIKSERDELPTVSGGILYRITKLDEHQSHRPIIPMLQGTVSLIKRKPLLYTGMQTSRFVRLQKLADEWNFPELKLLLTLRKLHLDEEFEILGDAFDLDKSTSEQYYHESRHTVLGLVDRLDNTLTSTSAPDPATNSQFEALFEPVIKLEKCDRPLISDPIAVDDSIAVDELYALDDSAAETIADDCDDIGFGLPTVPTEEETGWLSDDIRKRTGECSVCHKFYVPRLLNSHMETVHFNLSNLNRTICGLCWQEFATQTLLRKHQKEVHRGCSHGCDICGKRFASKQYLSVHILTRHTQLKTYLCDTCGEGFAVPVLLQYHMKQKHPIHGHDCHLCKMKFVTAAALNDHCVARHTEERRFKCDFKGCGKTFKWRTSFKSHRRVHASDKYECSVCLKRFSFKGNLRNHLKMIHNKIVANECLTSKII
ncbi:uncharacterized protein LOC119085530 [Bradysia coprophila]|uniref:uncharacterized protein LOC119085530 n=1 Tax=Bradysia coprophila TaxID=38358 RepID=UPI00187DD366|nr:uncharacterized protein LOC119085530 [Bradysia coprophila]